MVAPAWPCVSKHIRSPDTHLPAALLLIPFLKVIMMALCLSVLCASLRGQSTGSLGVVTCLCSAGKEAGVVWKNSVYSFLTAEHPSGP